jgi:hypothetical protein
LQTAGSASAVLNVQYSSDGGSSWNAIDAGTGTEVSIASGGGGSMQASAFVNLAAGAKADVLVRVAGIGGDGAADPAFGGIHVQFK